MPPQLAPSLIPLLAAPLLSACVSIAPPVRTGHYGAPGRVEAGMVEVAGDVAYGPDLAGGPLVGYGITDKLAIEGGAELGQGTRAIGWAGVRYTPLPPDPRAGRSPALVLDVEGGAGAGVGGRRCDEVECESSEQNLRRPAGGAYNCDATDQANARATSAAPGPATDAVTLDARCP